MVENPAEEPLVDAIFGDKKPYADAATSGAQKFCWRCHSCSESIKTPYEFICKCWTIEPERFILEPIHQIPGLEHLALIHKSLR